ncbi:MAG: uroporphyrinogen decarboxylase family protein [SAR324 cluster bacterium]|nr:uroporphyrinogen decarboxylase family protein [SAR324 cluster bacterium]MBL7034130.1 uroporphyrinogen decarboxylase family protein [SAR324 cluster bacterium]
MTKEKNVLMERVFKHLAADSVPVWLMRQAGRTDPEYNQLRKNDGRSLEKLFADPEIAIKISLLPKRLGVDAIIMFQDILTPLTPMGAGFRFAPGPILEEPVRTMAQVRALRSFDPETKLQTVSQILKGLNAELAGELPVLGFAGSPMSLAFFMIAGSSPNRNINAVLAFINEQPTVTQALLECLTEMTVDYLNFQIAAGAAAVQLFESFADVLPLELYKKYVQPTHEKIFSSLTTTTPTILFTKESPHLDLMLQSGASVLSVGSCIDLDKAQKLAPKMIFQGNVDNQILADGTKAEITEAVRKCLEQSGRKNHILNLNHGLLERTPFENVQHFVNVAKELGIVEGSI